MLNLASRGREDASLFRIPHHTCLISSSLSHLCAGYNFETGKHIVEQYFQIVLPFYSMSTDREGIWTGNTSFIHMHT